VIPVDKPFIPPIDDSLFKYLFGRNESKSYLPGLLGSILDIPADEYESITLGDPHLLRRYKKDKLGIVDIRIVTKSGTILNVEVQTGKMIGMRERVQYYSDRMFTDQDIKLNDRTAYANLKKTVVILIADYIEIREDDVYHHTFHPYDKEHDYQLFDKKEMHIIELPKKPETGDGSPIINWMSFLGAKTKEEIDMIAKKDPYIAEAVCEYEKYTLPKRLRLLYEANKKVKVDRAAREGWVEEEAHMKDARAMKVDGMDVSLISKYTGLSIEKIESL
jgi:predicted transposase/invertase (TIGR01784 family)